MTNEIDGGNVVIVVCLILLLIGIIFLARYGLHKAQVNKFSEDCENNPQLRYATTCTTRDDCISQCKEMLYKQSIPK